jgi:4-hydroxythreonine-4-phosphate dehydrogenase
MRVVLYTAHLPLKQVMRRVEMRGIESFIRVVDGELSRLFAKKFHFYVCGLNPHAGEEGYIGREEEEAIRPAIEAVQDEVKISGPYPADTVFQTVQDDPDSVVLAWYHDQGLIPFKLNHMHSGVNLTLGLPFVRTSPDHGTAYDIAGKGIANPASMMAAIRLADDLIASRSPV